MSVTQHSAPSTQHFVAYWREAAGALIVLLAQLATLPRTPWENDEFLFAEAVRKFEPTIWAYHPHPPGFPLYVLLGQAVHVLLGDPWRSLVVLAVLAAPVGFVALARALRRWIDDADLAVAAALLFYLSASMLVHGPLALSDPVAIAFVALTFAAMAAEAGDPSAEGGGPSPSARLRMTAEHDRAPIGIGLWSSAAIGCRPQLLVPLLPLLVIALVRLPTWRKRAATIVTFAVVSLMWFLPLLDAAGGPRELIIYETQQARYFALHDAAMSRGAKSAIDIATRFLLHPWGSKLITLPLLVLFALGIVPAWRRRAALLPLFLFTVVQIVFELGWMDPADAARYALPSMIFTAAVVALGLGVVRASVHVRAAPWIGAALFAIGAWAYVRPITSERTAKPSPAAAAAAYANAHFAPDTVILWDASLRPAAEYLLPRFRLRAIERGLRDSYARPQEPLVLFLDGGSHFPDARVFSWRESDAYGKLTRNHYRAVTLDPVEPGERYLPLSGVYPLERTVQGDEWRWLSRDALIRVPPRPRRSVELAFRLSPDAPYESNEVRVVAGPAAAAATVKKGETAVVQLPLTTAGAVDVRIVSARGFRPAEVLHNQDPRALATQLVYVRQQ